MVIDKLQNAIVTTYTGATALAAATPGGIHYDIAPSGETSPHVVYEMPDNGEILDTYSSGIDSSDVLVIFRVIAAGNGTTSGRTAGAAIMVLLIAAFNTNLTLTGGINYSGYQLSEPMGIPLPNNEQGMDVHQWSVPFVYSIQ